MPLKHLPGTALQGAALDVAQELLGCLLVCQSTGSSKPALCAGRIIETEAYAQQDPASHSFRGTTRRNQAMFGPAGLAYVYQSYGVHWCMNVVCEAEGVGAAVLIRALEPLLGEEFMIARRQSPERKNLCRGPGRLTQAMGISGLHNGVNLLTSPTLYLGVGDSKPAQIIRTRRIGISKGQQLCWRFLWGGHPWLSGNSTQNRPVP